MHYANTVRPAPSLTCIIVNAHTHTPVYGICTGRWGKIAVFQEQALLLGILICFQNIILWWGRLISLRFLTNSYIIEVVVFGITLQD